jgi:DNA-binding NarL/FixJ family response regulator
LRTKARIRYKKQERIQRQANERILQTLNSDQRRILALSQEGYEINEIARELALTPQYVAHFTSGLVQRLTHDGLIPSPEWRNVLLWASAAGLLMNA